MIPTIPGELLKLIQSGEGLNVEFKKSITDITKDVYQTVCAFSNRNGGHIFLGIDDSGTILGVRESQAERIKKDFVTSINNANRMFPPLYLQPIEYELYGAHIIYIYVPVSTSVCRCNGRIYDRNNDSDFDITDNEYEVYQLYAKKQDTYYVNKVFSVFSTADLRHDLINRARDMTRIHTQNHPWRNMTDEELLRSAKLILKDPQTGQEGITLASILLFGPDELIISVLAHHKTDAIFRVYNVDRYDDRDIIITNLLDSYDRLFAFGQKHLNDLFTLDGIISVSSRDKLLYEIISNLLTHRDFASNYVAKMVIEKDQIYTENANHTHFHEFSDPKVFTSLSKNPPISNVFREIGLSNGTGSGIKNTYKYTKLYSGMEPQFIEGDIFRTIIPIPDAALTVGTNTSINDIGKIENDVYSVEHYTVVNDKNNSDTGHDDVNTGHDTGHDDTNTGHDTGHDDANTGHDTGHDDANTGHDTDYEIKVNKLLEYCTEPRTRLEIQNYLGLSSRTYFKDDILKPLLKSGQLKMTIPDKPKSKYQKYVKN